ncbi:MAG: hypothetical protein ACW98K_13795 [Candidatus Kariarchaeaceae archaeon]|jgi:hypothetical protein
MVSEPDDMLVNAYRRVSYICSKCKTKRDVIVDQMMHLSRAELKQNGLAPYIDIHENLKTSSQDEHGMRIFVDTHFHVRSNDPMVRDEPIHEIAAKLPGLPMPKMAINNKKILYNSISWNSLELTSVSHNMGFFLVNPDPSLSETDNKVISINSPLNTIGVKINYQESRLSAADLENCNEWLSHLVKWIELTASLNIYIIPSLLFYIDIQHVRPPSVSDELIISILIDASAQILLGLNLEAFSIITQYLRINKYLSIMQLVRNLGQPSELQEQYLSTFVHLFFDLFRKDIIEYRVSYLM